MKKQLFFASVMMTLVLALFSCKKSGDSGATKEEGKDAPQAEAAAFNYTPAAVDSTNCKMKAIVELGNSGFNKFVVLLDKDGNWKSLDRENGANLISDDENDAAIIEQKLKDYIKSIIDFGVEGKNVHFVVSSGALKKPTIASVIKALEKIGYNVNTVTAEQEGECAYKCAVPEEFQNNAYVVDIGSGNTKIAYMQDGKVVAIETYGAKYFQNDVDDATVAKEVKEKTEGIPPAYAKTMFIMGGVPFQMAKSVKKGDERFTVLSTNADDFKALAEKEGEKVKCGLNIYKSLIDATGTKQVVFDWDSNFAIGFLLSLPY